MSEMKFYPVHEQKTKSMVKSEWNHLSWAVFIFLNIKRTTALCTDVESICKTEDSMIFKIANKPTYPAFLTLKLPDPICNSPYCRPYSSYNVSSENLVLDQLIIPKLIFFFILITYLVDIVLIL